MTLNPAQQKAVTGCGIQLVIAGPGSGKTRVITEKILHLLGQGVPPESILALTFSDKAAREMLDRLEEKTDTADLTVQTFHAFCLQVLEDNVLESGLNFSSGLITRTNQLVWGMKNIDSFGIGAIEIGNNAAGVIESVIDGISAFRDELITPDTLSRYLREKEPASPDEQVTLAQLADLHRVYVAYEHYKRAGMLLDYDDMITEAVRLFQEKPHILSRYRSRFTHILVDEFQDTNYAQFVLLSLLGGEQICVVGDDDQTIYRFRGAYAGNMAAFREQYAVTETLLDENYRNSAKILAVAGTLMAHAPGRQEKPLVTGNPPGDDVVVAECENDAAEAHYVLREIQRLQGMTFTPRNEEEARNYQLRDVAILCRKRADGLKFYDLLRRHGIPCEFSGEVDFFGLPAVRDIVAWLRVIDNPLATGIYVNRVMRRAGIPEVVLQRVNARANDIAWKDEKTDGVYEALTTTSGLAPADAHALAELHRLIAGCIARKNDQAVPELIYTLMMQATGIYRATLDDDRAQERQALHALLDLATQYDSVTRDATLTDFLGYLDLLRSFPVEIEETPDRDAVRIMTIHASKGREFPVVFLADLAQRKFPADYRRKAFFVPRDLVRGLRTGEDERALHLQEERRLCYVAMTRAQSRLYLTRAKRYGENKTESKPSRFLTEIGYTDNPFVSVISVPAEASVLRTEGSDPLQDYRHQLEDRILNAVSELRTGTALRHLIELEHVRMLAEGQDPETLDPVTLYPDPPVTTAHLRQFVQGEKIPLLPESLHFSASSLQTYQECPMKYKFQKVLLVPSVPKPYFSLGSVVHTVIEHLSRDQQEGIAPTRDRALMMLDQFWTRTGFSSRTQESQKRGEAGRLLDTYLAWQAENPNTILDIEQGFSFLLSGHPVTGYIDRVEQTPAGGYVVIDFKTGKKPGDLTKKSLPDNIQLNLYSLAVQELYGVLPQKTSLYFLGDDNQVDYIPTPESIAAFQETMNGLVEKILAEEFPATPSWGCRWCDYSLLCGEGEREE
jgi:DNA helicase-2/ATP-dependent DNA helicase PcrA